MVQEIGGTLGCSNKLVVALLHFKSEKLGPADKHEEWWDWDDETNE